MSDTADGLLLSDDLLFTSRITGAATHHGLTMRTARTAEQLLELAVRDAPGGVLLDLHNPGLDVGELVKKLTQVCAVRPRVLGYGSHVDAERLRAARLAGCDVVLPRSKFVEQLPTELPAWLGRSC
jgi:DNA-binding response OmpR family regulator